ncbi:MAG: hypothetical protein LAN63_19355, partial [Acidobacteriia bacterium]|nr:hypothetical protein [Terriglobia bacterium]
MPTALGHLSSVSPPVNWWAIISRPSGAVRAGLTLRRTAEGGCPYACSIETMVILATDTSGKYGSIALARGNPDGSCVVIEVVP